MRIRSPFPFFLPSLPLINPPLHICGLETAEGIQHLSSGSQPRAWKVPYYQTPQGLSCPRGSTSSKERQGALDVPCELCGEPTEEFPSDPSKHGSSAHSHPPSRPGRCLQSRTTVGCHKKSDIH